jgi:5-methyltetrahydrofolate--homocysteine methyltransferase
MQNGELLEEIGFNVIQGRVEASDEGIEDGLEGRPGVTELVTQALKQDADAQEVVLKGLTQPMEIVGERFESGEYLIPDMLASAECVGAAMEILGPQLAKAGVQSKGKFILATVAADLHDIGKNIVSIMLKGAGYEVVDLGTDVPTEKIVEAVGANGACFLGLSALLTTTMRTMEDVVSSLEQAGLRKKVKILIGGAPTSAEFAEQVGADAYCRDAFQAIDVLKELTH